MNKLYECVNDLQGGSFAVGEKGDINFWQEKAYDWLVSDNSSNPSQAYEKNIDDIAEWWQIEFSEVKPCK